MDIIINILSGVLATILIAFFIWIKNHSSHSFNVIKLCFSFYERIKLAGFLNFYTSRADYITYRGAKTLAEYLNFASKEIYIVGLWVGNSVESDGLISDIDRLLKNNPSLVIRIAILNPNNNSVIDALAKYLGLETKEVKSRITTSANKFRKLKEQVDEQTKLRLDFRYYNTIPAFSTILIDPETEKCRVQIDIKLYHEPRSKSFSLEFYDKDKYMTKTIITSTKKLFFDAISF